MPYLKCLVLTSFMLVGCLTSKAETAPPCGTPGNPSTYVDQFYNVIAYSNDSGGGVGCHDRAYEWECVEFIERYYSTRFNIKLGSIPVASETLALLKGNSQFVTFDQGSFYKPQPVPPQAEDIIVFGVSNLTTLGHVAIAKSDPILQQDGSYIVPIIEQNSYLKDVLVLTNDPARGFIITGRLGMQGTAPILGWVRWKSPLRIIHFTGKVTAVTGTDSMP